MLKIPSYAGEVKALFISKKATRYFPEVSKDMAKVSCSSVATRIHSTPPYNYISFVTDSNLFGIIATQYPNTKENLSTLGAHRITSNLHI